jgi:hypothetical protein
MLRWRALSYLQGRDCVLSVFTDIIESDMHNQIICNDYKADLE